MLIVFLCLISSCASLVIYLPSGETLYAYSPSVILNQQFQITGSPLKLLNDKGEIVAADPINACSKLLNNVTGKLVYIQSSNRFFKC